jgi:glycosyltransferase involved in cell wall biosynthesis
MPSGKVRNPFILPFGRFMGFYTTALLRSEPFPRRAAGFALRIAKAMARRGARLVAPGVLRSMRTAVEASSIDLAVVRSAVKKVIDVPSHSMSAKPQSAPRVVSVIGSLAAGGAERQLAMYVSEATRLGLAQHELVTLNRCEGVHAHHLPRVESAGVAIRTMGAEACQTVLAEIRADRNLRLRLRAVPAVLRPDVSELAGEFLRSRPDVVHAWLDHANIVAGIAALSVGVPRLILSLRSLHPGNFPALHRVWMHPCYLALAEDPRVRFVANSREGARSYAEWLGIDPSRIAVVLNGVDAAEALRPSEREVARVRAELAPGGARLVTGVMRLSEEKRPELFADVARRICAVRSDVHFAIAGDGPLIDVLRSVVRPLGSRFMVLGRRSDVPAILAASDAVLLTSRIEGTPNVLLEAQSLGTPVVSTRVGGVPDVVHDGSTGILAERDDTDGLVRAVLTLLSDEDQRVRMGIEAARTIAAQCSVDAMVRATDVLDRG